MKRSASTVPGLLLILLVSGCATGPQIKSDGPDLLKNVVVAGMFEGYPATAGG